MNFRDGGLDVSTRKPTLAFPQATDEELTTMKQAN